MENDIHERPISTAGLEINNKNEISKKPKGVWFVALWMLLHFGMVIIGLGKIASMQVENDFMAVRVYTLISLLVLVILSIGVVKPIKVLVNLTAFLFTAYGLYQVYLLILSIINAPQIIPVYRVLIEIIPSFICVWYLCCGNLRAYLNKAAQINTNA